MRTYLKLFINRLYYKVICAIWNTIKLKNKITMLTVRKGDHTIISIMIQAPTTPAKNQ